jgi:proteasome lid subunit RPN8/RPN11
MSGGVTIPGLSKRLRGAVYDHVYDNHTHEVGGVLVGDLGEGEMPVVSGCIAALEARGERASVTFTHDAWSSIHSQMESDFPGKQIVGWYHSHPGFGIFLSGQDIFIQENFFSDPRQIAYVVDPHAGTEGVFGWRAGKVELIEEAPAGRTGTGGTRPRAESSRSNMARYGGLAAVLVVFLGIGGGLVLSGRTITPSMERPAASPPTTGTPEPAATVPEQPKKTPSQGGKPLAPPTTGHTSKGAAPEVAPK